MKVHGHGVVTSVMIAALLAAGCGKSGVDGLPEAAAKVFIEPRVQVPGNPLKMTFAFTRRPTSGVFGSNYRVFVEFRDEAETVAWADEHVPSVPPRDWKPGESVSHTRIVFLPGDLGVGEYSVFVGVGPPDNHARVPLEGADAETGWARVGTVEVIRRSSRDPRVRRGGGWVPAGGSSRRWGWTQREARFSFPNPRDETTLLMRFDAPLVGTLGPQTVEVLIGDKVVDTVVVEERDEMTRQISLLPHSMGGGDLVRGTIRVDRTASRSVRQGGSTADRRVGVRVLDIVVDEQVRAYRPPNGLGERQVDDTGRPHRVGRRRVVIYGPAGARGLTIPLRAAHGIRANVRVFVNSEFVEDLMLEPDAWVTRQYAVGTPQDGLVRVELLVTEGPGAGGGSESPRVLVGDHEWLR